MFGTEVAFAVFGVLFVVYFAVTWLFERRCEKPRTAVRRPSDEYVQPGVQKLGDASDLPSLPGAAGESRSSGALDAPLLASPRWQSDGGGGGVTFGHDDVEELLSPRTRDAVTFQDDVSRAFPSWKRSILAEIYLWHACSCHEILRAETAGQVCLGCSPVLPRWLQSLYPGLLLLNVALFVSANTSAGASVFIVALLGPERIASPSLFTFSLVNSVRDMWNAGVYPLSILIAVFSGFWPYFKILLMLICWWTPPRFLPPSRREQMLMAVDALGKWSLLDAYVLCMMMVAFNFRIELASAVQPQPPSTLDVFVNPGWGFFGFLLATMLSLVLCHGCVACHRAVSRPLPDIKRDVGGACVLTH
jgi:hypothetical protein